MAVNKNFVVKNGLEVDTNLIVADANTNKVGIGTTVPLYSLHVFEGAGIGATNVYVTGITTVINELRVGSGGTIFSVIAGPTGFGQSVGVGTAAPAYLLDVRSPVSTGQTALYVQGDVRITGDLSVDDINFDDATLSNLTVTEALFVGSSPGISTFVGFTTFQDHVFIQDGLNVTGTGITGTTLNVSGVSTFVGFSTFQDHVFIQDGLNVTGTGITGTTLRVSGVSTFVGFSTFADYVFVQDGLISTGIVTGTSFVPSSGYIKAPDGTNSFFIYSGTGNVAFQGTIGASQLNSASGNKVVGLAVSDASFVNNVTVAGITTLGTVRVASGIVTAASGIVTYYGDGSKLTGIATGLTATIGISSGGSLIGTGISVVDFTATNATITVAVPPATSAGVATVNITPSVSLGLVLALGG
jgi:hypothetical protein